MVGINTELLKWMKVEAGKKHLPPNGWKGGLLFDEMAIQVGCRLCLKMKIM